MFVASTSLNRHFVEVGAAYVPSVVIVSIVLPATVYVVAVASLLAIVEMLKPDEAEVSPVNPAFVVPLLSRILNLITTDP